jgi:hypothetical protein
VRLLSAECPPVATPTATHLPASSRRSVRVRQRRCLMGAVQAFEKLGRSQKTVDHRDREWRRSHTGHLYTKEVDWTGIGTVRFKMAISCGRVRSSSRSDACTVPSDTGQALNPRQNCLARPFSLIRICEIVSEDNR